MTSDAGVGAPTSYYVRMKGNHRGPLRLVKRRVRHAWRARTGTELEPPKWVFVLGCYNSGTTLLVNLLDAHPALRALPREGVELTDRLPRPELFGWPRLWGPCEERLRVADSDAAASRIKRQWSHFVDDESAIVEKSPANLLRLEFLHRHFQPAYFIYIVRNGYAVAEGIRRKAEPSAWGNTRFARYPIELCARQWADADAALEAGAGRLERLLRLSYEEMTADVAGTLAELSGFLEIDGFDEQLAGQRWHVHRQEAPIANMNAQALSRLSQEERDVVYDTAGETLEKYGYRPG